MSWEYHKHEIQYWYIINYIYIHTHRKGSYPHLCVSLPFSNRATHDNCCETASCRNRLQTINVKRRVQATYTNFFVFGSTALENKAGASSSLKTGEIFQTEPKHTCLQTSYLQTNDFYTRSKSQNICRLWQDCQPFSLLNFRTDNFLLLDET